MIRRGWLMSFMTIVAGTAVSVVLASASETGHAKRPWLPADSVAVRYFDTPDVVGSHNGKRFFFVTDRGELSCDCNIFTLTVYDTQQVTSALDEHQKSPPQPLYTLTRPSSNHHGSEFSFAEWEPDGESIAFNGTDEAGERQTFEVNVLSGAMKTLTRWPVRVVSSVREGGTAIALIDAPVEERVPVYPVHALAREELLDRLFPRRHMTYLVSSNGEAPWRLKTPATYNPTSISGNGRYAIVVGEPRQVPSAWAAYDRLPLRADSGEIESRDALRFMLVDAQRHLERPALDAPLGTATQVGYKWARVYPEPPVFPKALWARDNVHVVLVNTAIPLNKERNPKQSSMSYIVSLNADTGDWAVIEPLQAAESTGGVARRVSGVGWLKDGTELLLTHEAGGKAVAGNVYTLSGDHWKGRSVAPSVTLPDVSSPKPTLTGGLSVKVRQSANEPPAVVASNGKGELTLTDSDPALIGIRLARQEPLQWKTPDGQPQTGGLLLPEIAKTQRVPLVIQAYQYEPERFAPDGPSTHAYAAQTLLAHGMAVLNVTIPALDPKKGNTPQELTDFAAEIDSAANTLATRGLIDRNRVGLIGFSRAGYETYYAISHPMTPPPAAAVIDDAFPGTYYYYMFDGAGGFETKDFSALYSGTFWQNKTAWLEREPSFNIDRVRTPALLTMHNQSNWLWSIDSIGAFSINQRPLEFLLFANGHHDLEMPRERVASQEASVDWMAFWLLGEVPPDSARAARWAVLRAQQQAVLDDATKKGEHLAPLPTLHAAPEWAIEAWRNTHRLIGDLAPDGTHLIATPEKDETPALKH